MIKQKKFFTYFHKIFVTKNGKHQNNVITTQQLLLLIRILSIDSKVRATSKGINNYYYKIQ